MTTKNGVEVELRPDGSLFIGLSNCDEYLVVPPEDMPTFVELMAAQCGLIKVKPAFKVGDKVINKGSWLAEPTVRTVKILYTLAGPPGHRDYSVYQHELELAPLTSGTK